MTSPDAPMKGEEDLQSLPSLVDPLLGLSKRRKLNAGHDYAIARRQMIIYGEGIIRSPLLRAKQGQPGAHSIPRVPLRHLSDRMLEEYRTTIHSKLPILDWVEFVQQYEETYRYGTLQNFPRSWIAVLFSVLACGSLNGDMAEGHRLLGVAKEAFDCLENDLTIDHARSATLMSLFFMETNTRSAAWMALGCAIRIAQDIGLHRTSLSSLTSAFEETARRRLWWSIYVSDR